MREPTVVLLWLCACGASDPPADPPPCRRGASLEVRRVDHGSPYMTALGERIMTSARPGDAIQVDAEALSPRPGSNETFPPRDRPRDLFLISTDRARLEHLLAAEPAPPAGREIRIEALEARPAVGREHAVARWRTYFVETAPVLDTTAIRSASASTDAVTKVPVLAIGLTRAGTRAFADVTAAVVADKLVILIDGDVAAAPFIHRQIGNGRFTVPVDSTAQAEALAARFACVHGS